MFISSILILLNKKTVKMINPKYTNIEVLAAERYNVGENPIIICDTKHAPNKKRNKKKELLPKFLYIYKPTDSNINNGMKSAE